MKEIFKTILFNKGFLVGEKDKNTNVFETLFALAAIFNIKIVDGNIDLVNPDMIRLAAACIGRHVPEPFYRGFPQSVRALSPDELLFDQMLHYFMGYGLGVRDTAGHSVLEEYLGRNILKENCSIREMRVITKEKALDKIKEYIGDLMASSRPLNDTQYDAVLAYTIEYGANFEKCASKNTAIRLLRDTRDLGLARFLMLSDVIKLVEDINYRDYGNKNIKKLNLRNQDRKFVAAVITRLFELDRCDLGVCSEKKAVWSGLLHHIHYQPPRDNRGVAVRAHHFMGVMRGDKNVSAYSRFEAAMAKGEIKEAVSVLLREKGRAAVLRNLTYIVSRCQSPSDFTSVMDALGSGNVLVLIQLWLAYSFDKCVVTGRTFVFTKFNRTIAHRETRKEQVARKSVISEATRDLLVEGIKAAVARSMKGKLGKVYIDPAMEKIALPIQENTSRSGLGVLPRGSRIPIGVGKKIRAFTYWEKVDDIDLSMIGITASGKQIEFSWRSMWGNQSDGITFSGDVVNGYNGGSEYFDLDVKRIKQEYPKIRYLVCCDNVYSDKTFSECICTAGFMTRDVMDSGEVFEPKTVKSSFMVDCDSTFAYLFAIDVEAGEFVWLNTARDSSLHVAGTSDLGFLERYFDVTSVINMASLYGMAAQEIVDDPAEADVVVSDRTLPGVDTDKQVRSCDFEKVFTLLNNA